MSFLSARRLGAAAILALSAACSSSSSSSIALVSATQDLTLDPTGQTTVLTFASALDTGLGASNFSASGGQTPSSVTILGTDATIVWNARVTPAHTISAVNAGNFTTADQAVAASDMNAPTFTAVGTQVAGVGSDTIVVTFSGARVVETFVEDLANWTLTNNGENMDLTGSVLTLNNSSQVMSVTLGSVADVFASFDLTPSTSIVSVADVPLSSTVVVGSATGDSTPPTLVSVVQNLVGGSGGDEFGSVIDLTFSEPMSPVFGSISTNFAAIFPVFAQTAAPVAGSPNTIRVSYSGPVVPSVSTVSFANLVDTHGNTITNQPAVAVSADGSIGANAFTAVPSVTTVSNTGGDVIVATFTDALDPTTVNVAGNWFLESPDGNPIGILGATYVYVESTKTLTVTLANDVLNTDSFDFGATIGSEPRNIDGTDFTATQTGTVTGEATAPTIASVVQNRAIDSDGLTFDVTYSEDVDETTSETTTNYVFSSGSSVTSADLLPAGDLVRVVLSAIAVPGEHTIDVSGVNDLAGNTILAVTALAMTSTDVSDPLASAPMVEALSGSDNDSIVLAFDDDMFTSEVTDVTNWTVESPTGVALDTTNATITYSDVSDTATMVFDGGDDINFQSGDDFNIVLATMRDIGGNVVSSTAITGDIVAESVLPQLESVWFEDAPNNNIVHLRFDEECTEYDDIASGLTRFVIRDSGGADLGGGTPTVTPDTDGRGVALTFGVANVSGNTLDVRGVTDLTGNQMVPVETITMEVASSNEPAVSSGTPPVHVSMSGEENDQLVVVFDEPVSSFGLFDAANWTLTNTAGTADFSLATFAFDGISTVTVDFDLPGAFSFDQSANTLSVDNLFSGQGVEMTAPSAIASVPDAGNDAVAAAAGSTRLDAVTPTTDVFVEFDEAINETDAAIVGNYLLGGVTAADSASIVGPRTVRLSFVGGATTSDTIDVTVEDLAGNAALATHAILAADSAGPTISSVQGVAVAGVGNDRIEITYSAPVGLTSGLTLSNYVVTQAGVAVSLTGATATWDSAGVKVVITLDSSIELTTGLAVNVMAAGILNHALIAMSPTGDVNGVVAGDSVAPSYDTGFVNFRADVTGTMVDLFFDEAIDTAFAALTTSYTSSGSQTVTAVEVIDSMWVRLTLSAALVDGEMISTSGLLDLAGNTSGAVMVTPLF